MLTILYRQKVRADVLMLSRWLTMLEAVDHRHVKKEICEMLRRAEAEAASAGVYVSQDDIDSVIGFSYREDTQHTPELPF